LTSKYKPMTGKEYKAAIAQLGLSQQAAGVWLGLSKRTGHSIALNRALWTLGEKMAQLKATA